LNEAPARVLYSGIESATLGRFQHGIIKGSPGLDPATSVEATEERVGLQVVQDDVLELVDVAFEAGIVRGVFTIKIIVFKVDKRTIYFVGRCCHDLRRGSAT